SSDVLRQRGRHPQTRPLSRLPCHGLAGRAYLECVNTLLLWRTRGAAATPLGCEGRLEMADIKANKGTDKDYDEKKVRKLVKDIKARPIGQVIVAAIENTGKQLTIRPESERPPKSFDPTLTYRVGELSATFPVDSAGKLNHAAASPANL